ncbi:MAG: hypothetical protein ACR2NP_19445 [Pirellulaceae bacterium]
MNRYYSRIVGTNTQGLEFEALEPRRVLATLIVTTNADVIDANDGLLSLREAIIESNTNGEADQIELSALVYEIEIAGFKEDLGLTGDFDVFSDSGNSVVIRGIDSTNTIIDAKQLDRAFDLMGQSTVTLENLTIQNGSVLEQAEYSGRRGGAIKSTQSSLTLNNLVIQDSTTGVSGVGGAVWTSGGSYSINSTDLHRNIADTGSAVFARNSTGTIHLGQFADNEKQETIPRVNFDPGVIGVREGSLDLTGTRIDDNNLLTGILAFDASLMIDHARFLDTTATLALGVPFNYGHGIRAVNSDVMVIDSRFSLMGGDAIHFTGPDNDLWVTDTLFRQNYESTVDFDGSDINLHGVTIEHDILSNRDTVLEIVTNGIGDDVTLHHVTMDQVVPSAIEIDGPSDQLPNVHIDGLEITGSNLDPFRDFVNIRANELTMHNSALNGTDTRVTLDAQTITLMDVQMGEAGLINGPSFVNIIGINLLMDEVSIADTSDTFAVVMDVFRAEIRNSDFSNNRGGIFATGSGNSLLLTGSRLNDNTDVGGLSWGVSFGDLKVFNSQFNGNTSTSLIGGAGLAISNTNTVLVANSEFVGNYTEQFAFGALRFEGDGIDLTVANSLFDNNLTQQSIGAAIVGAATNSTLKVYTSTFVRNGDTQSVGGAIAGLAGSNIDLFVTNSIFVSNGYDGHFEDSQIFNAGATTLVTFSNIDDFNPEDGNIFYGGAANNNTDFKARFVDFPGGDFRLRFDSPLIGQGNNNAVLQDVFDLNENGNTTEPLPDLDLLDRIVGATVDMGAYEFQLLP